jgi:hypothetical protein
MHLISPAPTLDRLTAGAMPRADQTNKELQHKSAHGAQR